MSSPEHPERSPETTAQQVNDLFDSLEFGHAVESEEFKHFLDHIPIAIAISKLLRGDQRIFYANMAFETLLGRQCQEFAGRGWGILANFRHENDANVTLPEAVLSGEEFLGTFRANAAGDTGAPKPVIVDAYVGIIENEDGSENYRIAALIDVTDRERADHEEFARRIQDKDTLLKELQHRVKNNLQLIRR